MLAALDDAGPVELTTKLGRLTAEHVEVGRGREGGDTPDAFVECGQPKRHVATETKGREGNWVVVLFKAINDGVQVGQPLGRRKGARAVPNSRHGAGRDQPSRFVRHVFGQFREHAGRGSTHAEGAWQTVNQDERSANWRSALRLEDVKIKLRGAAG